MDLIERLLDAVQRPTKPLRTDVLLRDAIEAIEQLRAQVQMLGKEPVA